MKLYVNCEGGLSNRFNSLITGLIISKKLNIKPILLWPKGSLCLAAVDQIIDKNWINAKFEDVIETNVLPNANILGHRKTLCDKERYFSIYLWPFLKSKIRKSRSDFVIESDLPPWWVKFDEYKKEMQGLEYSKYVLEYANQINDNIKFDLGMHIRQGDWGERSINIIINSLRKARYISRNKTLKNKKMYIASDSKLVPQIINDLFPSTVSTGANVIKNYEELSSSGELKRNELSVIYGAAEQLVLSKTSLFATSYSSFLYTAYLKSKKPSPTLFDRFYFYYVIKGQYNLIQFERYFDIIEKIKLLINLKSKLINW